MNALKKQYQNAPVTTVIFLVTIFIFLVEFILSRGNIENSAFLIGMGAKWGPYIELKNEYWRLVTPIFLHAGFLHIITNMITLWFIGPLVERAFGSIKFFGLYFFGGVVGNIFSYLLAPETISVGASTALFAMFGGMILYAIRFKEDPQVKSIGTMLVLFVILNLVTGFSSTDIDIWGHIGGLVGGMMFAVMFGFYGLSGKYAVSVRLGMGLITIVLIILTFWVGVLV
ncbi:rhomboid family intramembrane serine protease [Leuconostoc litchii]|uniref:Rhomboid family intramembrane serine protease n=1 Tax=Leuconostoc litchii TaxID=1981069 RepID=A0A6P2CPE6_9LACO|nr:rhomboid family intramembrane serine protease [Leuconostoc litchii]TYC47263.1 rhomboid family intramembrane serine protease [Leuconostoc litchii]GMA69248.1 rhomboid family intramembrane serine protease [Leuconostoc litchii]